MRKMQLIPHLCNLLYGFCIGVADIVPGVSGGTMACVLGIYQRLLKALAGLVPGFRRLRPRVPRFTELGFLLSLTAGVSLALLVCVHFFKLHEQIQMNPRPFYGLFSGLIAGTCLMFLAHVRWRFPHGPILVLVGALVGFGLLDQLSLQLPAHVWTLFLCGLVSICATLLPGVSGSYVLLLMGQYEHVLGAIDRLDLQVLLPFGGGLLLGLLFFSKFLHWILNRFREPVLLLLHGLLLASLLYIQPLSSRLPVLKSAALPDSFAEFSVIFVLSITGFAVSVFLYLVRERKKSAGAHHLGGTQ